MPEPCDPLGGVRSRLILNYGTWPLLWTVTSMRCSRARTVSGPTGGSRTSPGGTPRSRSTLADPVTGAATPVLVVKGSGGDLGTLTADGLALLDLDRLRALERLSRGGRPRGRPRRRLRLVPLRHRWRGAVDRHAVARVPRRRPRRPPPSRRGDRAGGRRRRRAPRHTSATATTSGWLDWRRPGFDLGLRAPRLRRRTPRARAVSSSVVTASSAGARRATSARPRRSSSSPRAERFLADRGADEPLGALVAALVALPDSERHFEAARLGPVARAIAGAGRPLVGHFTDSPVVLDFLSREAAPRLARSARRARTTSSRRRSGRCCSTFHRARRSSRASHGCASCTSSTAPTTAPTTTVTPPTTRPRCGARTPS